ncbi:M81 family metallopeptidase [Dongia soli]|uniref:Microcystinase C n=1 Tax=Dongia soli TaxID=600628 RepID=A0ABU5EFC3_9PROT|nr:M81 family metallopeptidase [Dongia soli]MDY0885032.1 M81 family metallopeptidase [Dongia soli]
MMRRLAVARLWYEGNSFTPVTTGIEIFRAREWVSGDAAKDFYRGTATEIGAAVAFAESQPDWQVEFLLCTAAPPGGPVTPDAFATIRAAILDGLRQQTWDAVYLSLHGATVLVDNPTPELDLLRDVRAVIGDVPLGASFDLHAHLSPEIVAELSVAAGYKTYPHIDMAETAMLVLHAVTATAEKRIAPEMAIAKLPAILPSFNMRTTDGPMAELQQLAQDWRRKPKMIDVSLFGGFAYGDSPFAGPSVIATTDGDPDLAQRAVTELSAAMATRRDDFYVSIAGPAEGLRQALGLIGDKPAAVIDPSDNPLSGGIGDTPGLFRALLELRPNVPAVFGFFWDPPLVARCHAAGIGQRLSAALGGRITQAFGAPVEVEATVLALTDGQFRNLGPMETNLPVNLGRTALLDVQGIKVIVTESCQTPNDPGYFELHGIDLGKTGLLCVKAKNHFRAAFKPLTRAIIEIDAPGPASPNIRHYSFRHAPRHLYPLTEADDH